MRVAPGPPHGDDSDGSTLRRPPTSPLWHGGGQWLLYGLGLVLRCKIFITSLCKTTDRTLVLPLRSALLLDRRRPNPKP